MQQFPRLPAETNLHLVETMDDLRHGTSRAVMVVSALFAMTAFIVAAGNASTSTMAVLLLTGIILTGTMLMANRVLESHYALAQILWQTILIAGSTLAILILHSPESVFVYATLPLIAVITIDWRAGVVVQAAIIVLMSIISHWGQMLTVPLQYRLVVTATGAFTGFLGWAATNSLLTATRWAVYSFGQARSSLESAREQRVELKQVQEDLIQANSELARLSDRLKVMHHIAEEARQAKVAFVSNVSHELRTPLNLIIGFAEVISQSPPLYGHRLPTVLLSDISAIQRNAQHLSQLVNDVLDLSQAEAGQMALSREWFSLQDVIQDAMAVVRGLFDSKGLYLRASTPENLPQVFADNLRIRQVIVNLLSNAGRFTERGGVLVGCEQQGEKVVVSVSDTGPGIAPDDQNKLFEPFQQVDNSIRRTHGGSGLGLSISRQFVEMHGGEMSLESQVGIGTTICFTLPLSTIEDRTHTTQTASPRRWFNPYESYDLRIRTRSYKAPTPIVKPRILIVEKENRLGHLFGHYLKDIEFSTFRDIENAINTLESTPAQALVINTSPLEPIPLPAIASLPYGTPAISCWVPGLDQAARKLGVVDYLIKPLTQQALLTALAHAPGPLKTILVVDDERDELHLFARMLALSDQRFRVIEATSGMRALSILRQRHPDILLLDLLMPGIDGFEVLRAKAKDPSICDIPVIVVTSRDPTGTPSVGSTVTITRNGLSARDLAYCIQAVGEVLSPLGMPKNTERDVNNDAV